MGHALKTGNVALDLACLSAEAVRQSAVAGAAQSPAGQAAVTAAEIACARIMVANCNTFNGGFGAGPYVALLRSLGTGGV
jgi:hypothetical protein